jgi:hypothetical protein
LGFGGFLVGEGKILLGQVFTGKTSPAQDCASHWAALGHGIGLLRRIKEIKIRPKTIERIKNIYNI